ncbi:MAG: ABC transporter ATP-binding protein [Burkholderiaceae bacterium]
MQILEVSDLTIRRGQRRLIEALSWQVHQGELWCVLGRNGAGKSTLLHTLAGLHGVDQGHITLMGRALSDLSIAALARLRGLMPQQTIDRFSCPVAEAVAIGRAPWRIGAGWQDEKDRSLVHDALNQVGMLDRLTDDVTHLSGGERQRVAFAAMLAQNPKLMLLDEPTAHQDIGQQLLIMRLMRALAHDHAVIAACHDLNLAARFATHVLLLGEGCHYLGPTQEVMIPETLNRVFGCAFDYASEQLVAV